MKKFAVMLVATAILLCGAGSLYAATSIYGQSGLIETPNDVIVGDKAFEPAFARIFDLKVKGETQGVDVTTYGGAIGILPNLEVSAVGLDPESGKTEALINAKYRVLAESESRPSVTVGVLDISKRLDYVSDDPSAFIVIGKNISPMAEGFSGRVSQPVKGTIGFGSGIYKGVFAGLDMSLAPKLNVAVEYLRKGIRNRSTANGMVRFTPVEALSIDAGLIGFKDFYAGASYNVSTF
ncbi:MAG: hypothetical protein ACOX3G_12600 [Armatimonadota bacterium]|jgi:hypothetical protein